MEVQIVMGLKIGKLLIKVPIFARRSLVQIVESSTNLELAAY